MIEHLKELLDKSVRHRPWTWWAACMTLVVLLLMAWDARANPVTVTYQPATTDEAGAPLGPDTWTVVQQMAGRCPGLYQQAGQGAWNTSGPYEMVFEQPAGTCACYIARTVALDQPQTARVSVPAQQEWCLPAAGCSGCHG